MIRCHPEAPSLSGSPLGVGYLASPIGEWLRMGVDQSTLRGWEARLHQPTGKSLDVIVSALENWYQVDAVGSCQFSEQSIQGKPSSSMLDCRAPTSQFPPVRVPRFMAGHCLRSN